MLVAALFMGCNRDKKKEEPTGPYIFFETQVGETGTLPQQEGEAFGVFGYYSVGESLNNVFTGYDDKIAKVSWRSEDRAYAYDKLAKWSEGTYSFYAYYPYAYRNQERLTVVDDVRSKTLKFSQPSELEEMVNFMTASVESVVRSAEPVRFQFEPKLFKVDVVVANGEEGESSSKDFTILDAVIYFTEVPQSLECDIDGTDVKVSVETMDIEADLYLSSTEYLLESGKKYNFTKEIGNSFRLIPDKNIKYSLSIEYMDEYGEPNIYTYPEDKEWASFGSTVKAGGEYTIVINRSKGTLYPFTSELVVDWEDEVDIDNDFN